MKNKIKNLEKNSGLREIRKDAFRFSKNLLALVLVIVLFVVFAQADTWTTSTSGDFGGGTYTSTTHNGSGVVLGATFDSGDGSDGALTVSAAGTNINTYTYLTGDEKDNNNVITVNSGSGLSNGDEVLVIQMQDGGDTCSAGVYEIATITSGGGTTTLTLDANLGNDYCYNSPSSNSASIAQVVRIPQYTDVTVNASASIKPTAWNGYTGGIVIFKASGTVTNNGTIDASQRGFRGGTVSSNGPETVTGYTASGGDTGDGTAAANRWTGYAGGGSGTLAGNGGSGTYGSGGTGREGGAGGGGFYANYGGSDVYYGCAAPGGGASYTSADTSSNTDLSVIALGAGASQGAGGGSNGQSAQATACYSGYGGQADGDGGTIDTSTVGIGIPNYYRGGGTVGGNGTNGAAGGGIIMIGATNVISSGADSILATGGSGGTGGAGAGGSWGAGGGGGEGGQGAGGGSVLIYYTTQSPAASAIGIDGGSGGTGGAGGSSSAGSGGNGGSGAAFSSGNETGSAGSNGLNAGPHSGSGGGGKGGDSGYGGKYVIANSPYLSSGEYTSQIFDAGSEATWNTISWTSSVPANTTLDFSVRSCNDAACSGESWVDITDTSPQSLSLVNNQYGQYKAVMTTSDTASSPSLTSVSVDYSVSTCLCPGSGNAWEIDLSENCVISTDCDIGTGDISFINSGSLTISANVYFDDIGAMPNGSTGYVTSTGTMHQSGN